MFSARDQRILTCPGRPRPNRLPGMTRLPTGTTTAFLPGFPQPIMSSLASHVFGAITVTGWFRETGPENMARRRVLDTACAGCHVFAARDERILTVPGRPRKHATSRGLTYSPECRGCQLEQQLD